VSFILSTFQINEVGPAEKNVVSCGFLMKLFKAFWISQFFQSAPTEGNRYSFVLCFDLLDLLCQISDHLK